MYMSSERKDMIINKRPILVDIHISLITRMLKSKVFDKLEPTDGPKDDNVSLKRLIPFSIDVAWITLLGCELISC